MSTPSSYEHRDRAEALYRTAEIKAELHQGSEPSTEVIDEKIFPSELRLLSSAIHEMERRAVRRRYLPSELFSDTGWVILLDLFISQRQMRTIFLSGSANRWSVSEATAARYIAALIASNLVMRTQGKSQDDPDTLHLTESGQLLLKRVLSIHE